ncbi:MAG TPA: flavin reductase family protein [Pelagibacterium sp.]|uniref:flavin reductase family protein n=1 Tax=Pelagibacterium sp. TaxID=1967288 RepID=UPI002C5D0F4A|nr:flavin reductase family protein [Pelagibacterium sp.]HWJ86845.1 flavin reductase family protein [Pelagibacterium sp.]
MTISDPIHTPEQAFSRLAFNCADHPAARDAVPMSQFTGAMSTLASSVSVVTAALDGERHGRTVTAMLSLSAEPPAVLVSITRDSDLAAMIDKAGKFSLSILADDQRAVADAFAGWGPADRFEGWSAWPSGQPRLEGAVASFDCALAGTIVLDTHILYAGIVLHTASYPDRTPLLWHQRRYAGVDVE